jgi:O-antigen ligase
MPGRLSTVTPDQIDRWSFRLIGAGLVFALILVLLFSWVQPTWLLGIPAVLIGGLCVAYLIHRPVLHLVFILVGFVLIAGQETGLQISEILYGVYYLTYLGGWFIAHFFIYEDEVLWSTTDKALFLFLLYATASVGLTLLFGGKFQSFMGEWLSLSLLAFYFPVKNACRRYKGAPYVILGVLFWFATFGAVRNLIEYREALQSAEYAWQILRGRVNLNEIFFLMASLASGVFVLHASSWRRRILFGGLFAMSFVSLLLTQSRGYWMAFIFGCLLIFFLIDYRRKIQTIYVALFGVSSFVIIGFLLYPDFFQIIALGLLNRVLSIPTAIFTDVSLVNRYQETRAVWGEIQKNPILGYGMGVEYNYFYLIPTVQHTRTWAFVHNGYAALWYKFGIIGLGLMLYFWISSIRNGITLWRNYDIPRIARLVGLVAAAGLFGETIVANTSNPFIISDGCLLIGILGGLVSGCLQKYHGEETKPPGQ